MPKPQPIYEHKDRYNRTITVDSIVAFCYAGGNQIHLGRVTKITAKRIQIAYTYEYTTLNGTRQRWNSTYRAHPHNILVLNNIEQELTIMALKGLV